MELRELHVTRAFLKQHEVASLPVVSDPIVARIIRLRDKHLKKAQKRHAAKMALVQKPMTCTEEVKRGGEVTQCGAEAMPQFDRGTEEKPGTGEYMFHACPHGHRSFAQRSTPFDKGWVMGPNGRGYLPPLEKRTERADPRMFPSQGRSTGVPFIPDSALKAAAELAQGIQSISDMTARSGYSQAQEWVRVREQKGLVS